MAIASKHADSANSTQHPAMVLYLRKSNHNRQFSVQLLLSKQVTTMVSIKSLSSRDCSMPKSPLECTMLLFVVGLPCTSS